MIRPYQPSDELDVLGLINARQIPGQPRVSVEMLADALVGRSPIDSSFWAELDSVITVVARGETGELDGVISFAARQRDNSGVILWLYAAEQGASTLIDHALAALGRRTVIAYDFASALTLGLEALPVKHHARTRAALEAAGFLGSDEWRYIRRRLNGWPVETIVPDISIIDSETTPGWELMMRAPDGALLGEASIGRPVDGIGVLWWITVVSARRGEGLGRKLLGQCFSQLVLKGAREVIAFVDDDAPAGDERDRGPANRLYDSMGFEEIDRLWSFTFHAEDPQG